MKKAITNDGPNIIYHGGLMIPPGETRHFEVPDPPAAAAVEDDPLTELFKGKAAAVIAAVPSLSDEDLVRLEAMENEAPKIRTTVVHAIAEEGLKRADAKQQASKGEGGGE